MVTTTTNTGSTDPGRGDDPRDELLRFARLVKLMRALQGRYFDGERSATLLRQCRDAERRVDKAVRWIEDNRQQRSFLQ